MRHARITSRDLARILVPILLILLILTYASLPFLPHSQIRDVNIFKYLTLKINNFNTYAGARARHT